MMKKNQRDIKAIGEGFVNVSHTIKSIENLDELVIQELKKQADRSGSCIVYVDVKGFWIPPFST